MASSSSSEEANPPWQELPREITETILQKVGPFDILTAAVEVCTTWRSVCREPSMWRCIDMRSTNDGWEMPFKTDEMCRHAVDLSRGQLIDLIIEHFATGDLLLYISQRSSQLKRLQLINCREMSGDCLIEAIKNFPKLEELHLDFTAISAKAIKTIGRSCPSFKSFKLNTDWVKYEECDVEALAIARSLPGLSHLQLIGNRITDKGLKAILEGCPNLESLDLRRCFKVRLSGDLGQLCSERIKDLKLPHDPMDDHRFGTEVYGDETSDDDYDDDDDYVYDSSDMDDDYEDYLTSFSGDDDMDGYSLSEDDEDELLW